jgi:hypothetical protein
MPDLPINVVRFQNKVRAILGMRGENPVPDLTYLHTSLVLEADRPEWGYAGNEFPWAGSRSVAAAVGQLSAVGLRNPRTSGVIAVVEFVRNTSVNAGDIIVGQTQLTGAPDTVVGEISNAPATAPRDTRILNPGGVPGSGSSSLLVFSAQSATGIGASVYTLTDSLATLDKLSRANDSFYAILAPGGFVGIQTQAVNLVMSANWRWYERVQERGLVS